MTSASNLSRLVLPEALHKARREAHNLSVSQPGTPVHVESLCRLAEYACRFAVHVRICALRDVGPEGEGVARINALAFLGPLTRPSFGQLVSMLQQLDPLLEAAGETLHPHIRHGLAPDMWLGSPRLLEAARALRGRTERRITTLGAFLLELVTLRNAGLHPHARPLTEADSATIGPALHEGLAELLESTPLLAEWSLLFVTEVVAARAGLALKGVSGDRHAVAPLALRASARSLPPEPQHLHLIHLDPRGDGIDGIVDLFPLMGFDPNDARHPLRVFCDGTRGRPRFEDCDERNDAQTEAMQRFTVMLGPPRAAVEDHFRDVADLVTRLGDAAGREVLENSRRILGLTPERAAALEREAARTAPAATRTKPQLTLPLGAPVPATSETRQHAEALFRCAPGVARLDDACAVEVTAAFVTSGSPDAPLEPGTWFDAVRACNARSASEGLAPAYVIDRAAAPRTDLRFHEVRASLAPVLGESVLADLEGRFFFEPGRGGRRKERKVPEPVIAAEIVSALCETPGRLVGSEAARRLEAAWDGDAFFAFEVLWQRGAAGWRLPTEAEWRLLALRIPLLGPEWVWDLDPDVRPRSGVHPGAPPRGAFVDWCGEVGGPRRLWMAVEHDEVTRRCALPWDAGKRLGARPVRAFTGDS